jgi:aminoglycoside phosphotransferase family enzyme
LALECDRLGYTQIGRAVLEHYRECARDECDRRLLDFYRALRAFVRAKVAAWHLEDGVGDAERIHWRDRAGWYLAAAAQSLGFRRLGLEASAMAQEAGGEARAPTAAAKSFTAPP